ncbi:MAG TPA: RNA polymerase sigma factor SigJ [Polyangiales bacterium]|nr:RNA polymerase sigma factor SigJ [Polyangiales bacterium]
MEHPQVNDAATLDRERSYLIGIAYRMLGSRSDAEDVVQEALLRAMRHEEALRTPRAFLTTVVTRLCLDELGSARRRREDYVGPYFPEPVLTDRLDVGEDPTEYRENVSVALLLVLDKLSPAERAVFVLRDVFDLDYEVIAEALQRSEAGCRKLLQRAREQLVDAQHQQPAAAAEQLAVSDVFFRALTSGDLQGLIAVLAEDASMSTDHGGKASAARRMLEGSEHVARFLHGIWNKRDQLPGKPEIVPCYLNGAPGVVITVDGEIFSTFTLRIVHSEGGARIAEVAAMRNPDKLELLAAALKRNELLAVSVSPDR